ncbi:MAG: condensation domain-containing protein [Thermoanaerobaculia bacterium]
MSRRASSPAPGPGVPLSPMQRRFFALGLSQPDHWCQVQLLAARQRIAPGRLVQIVAALLEHHEALRQAFARDGQGVWRARLEPAPLRPPVAVVDLGALEPAAARSAVRALGNRALSSLRLAGPLARVVLFEMPAGLEQRLLFVLHHLISDRPSWQILLADFLTLDGQLEAGRAPELPAPSTRAAEWVAFLEAETATRSAEERAFWRGAVAPAPPLPQERNLGPNRVASASACRRSLPLAELLGPGREPSPANAPRLQALLLATLARALGRFSGAERLRFELRASGRERPTGLDLSRTVGWLTHAFPVALEVAPGEAVEGLLARVEGSLERAGDGAGFGELRTWGGLPELEAASSPEVGFSFLGWHPAEPEPETPLVPMGVELGPLQGPANPRPYVFEITAEVLGAELLLHLTYSQNLHRPATVERLARRWERELRAAAKRSLLGPPAEPSTMPRAHSWLRSLLISTRDSYHSRVRDPWTYRRDRVLLLERRLEGLSHLVASRQGLYAVAPGRAVKVVDGQFFGLSRRGEAIYAFQANDRLTAPTRRGRLLRLELEGSRIRDARVVAKGFDNGCHQLDFIGDRLYLLDTYNNRVLVLGPGFEVEREVYPLGPAGFNQWDEGYGHLNSILWHRGEIYLLQHNGTPKTGRPSELLRCDLELNVLEARPVPGGGCHNIVFLEDGSCLICDSQGGNLISPEGVVLHVDEMWTRGLAVDAEQIVVGSSIYGADRRKRRHLPGKVYFFDRRYRLLSTLEVPAAPTDIRRIDGEDLGLSSYQRRLAGLEHPAAAALSPGAAP